ncbi:MAG: sulfurtransferase TusA family protein [Candidatus Riflebacteria bacterium]|nr:sulfurtransferase TusA family protein [Candidatus Riflebacteria bacterium]
MPELIDARGLSCPQPVLITLKKIREMKTGEIEVIVDSEAAVENVSRMSNKEGWKVEMLDSSDDTFKLLLKNQ